MRGLDLRTVERAWTDREKNPRNDRMTRFCTFSRNVYCTGTKIEYRQQRGKFMANGVSTIHFSKREDVRENTFNHVWTQELDEVFADVAGYYDKANYVASLGLWGIFRDSFLSIIELQSKQKVLDVCAGTNAVGIALLHKQPDIEVYAIDRSKAMQQVGRDLAEQQGFRIESTIGDVHRLPFPDDYFDVVTLQFASRHLRVMEVFGEIKRVLKPGGHFYHSDMLRPRNRLIETIHYSYLRLCLTVTAWIFRSGPAALNCKKYFVNTLSMFYSAEELSVLLKQMDFQDVSSKTLFGGLLGFHKAVKK
jgi:demethylmenaquinone methyltransferase / 2-methoxy-6-polyprenyl-1,4-benzoquinol methylase